MEITTCNECKKYDTCKIEYNDICGFEVKDKYEINISIIVDYDPKQYLDSTKFDLSHRFDIPIENIRIKSSKCINYKQVFEFIEQYKKDLDKQEIEQGKSKIKSILFYKPKNMR